jgi:hypothetical protein
MALGRVRTPQVTRSVFGWWLPGGFSEHTANTPVGTSSEGWERWRDWIIDHIQRDDNGDLINMRTLTIELRFDADEEERHAVLRDAAMQAAKHLYTSALLISAKRKPQIAMYTSDMFVGREEIMLSDDLTPLGEDAT